MVEPHTSISRRQVLRLGGGVAVGLLAAACSNDEATSEPDSASTSLGPGVDPPASDGQFTGAVALGPADFDALGTCLVFPESTAGPFPLDAQFDRRDITEGYPGHPVRLGLRVVDASCAPMAGATVEVWHTDATGDYSAFEDGGGGKDEGRGTTFCRGTQVADGAGITEFHTIYPGWYPGRAVHVHLRVRVDGELVRTGQLYFDDAYTADVLATGPYAEFGLPSTTNATDGLAGDPASDGTLLTTTPITGRDGRATLALANLGLAD